jgi:colanic acid biosynthesis glycosyl transferase WcaI
MSRYLAAMGHKVTVVTEVPNHPSGIIPPRYRGRLSERVCEDGVDVLRLWVSTSPEKTFKSRMRFYLSYMAMGALAGSLLRGRYDLVYATSPPLFVGPAGLAAAMVRRVPFVFEVRDLWPESAVALGELNGKRAIRAAEVLERYLYRRAARIVVVTEGIRKRLVERGLPPEKLALIPNGADTDRFRFDPEGRARVRATLGVDDKFVAMYAGIHGLAQGMESLVEVARLLEQRPDIVLVFIGEGPKKAAVAQLKKALGLENLMLLPEVQVEEMPAHLSAADCCIVPLRDDPLFRGALPSKMFEAWACSRPVVLSVAGEAVEALKSAGGGITARPGDPAEIASAIEYLEAHREEAHRMGLQGRSAVEAHYSRREQARQLEALLRRILI